MKPFALNIQAITTSLTRRIRLQLLLQSASFLYGIRRITIDIIRDIHALAKSSLHLFGIHPTKLIGLALPRSAGPSGALTEDLPGLEVLLSDEFILESGAFLDVLVGARSRVEGLLDAIEVSPLYL